MYHNWDTAYSRADDHEQLGRPLPKSIRRQKEDFGFSIYLVRQPRKKGGYAILSGCRFLSPEEAMTHWRDRSTYEHSNSFVRGHVRERAVNMLELLPELRRRAKSYGWI